MDNPTSIAISVSLAQSTRNRRRKIFLLRGALLVAVGALLLSSGTPGPWALGLIVVYAVTELLLALAPLHWVRQRFFTIAVGAVDLLLVATGLLLAGMGHGALWASALLMILVVALGNYKAHTVAGAAAVGAFHSWLVLGPSAGTQGLWDLALQILFLCTMALYYGYVVREIHLWRRRAEAEEMENTELRILLEVLETISSSLDLHRVCLTIVSKITRVIPALRCSMLFVDRYEEQCFVIASNDDPNLTMLEIDLKKYPEVRRAIETRNPVLVQNAPNDLIMAEVRDLLQGLDFRSILVVPLTFGEEVLGTLCLKTTRGREEYLESEIKFCTAMARASANALKNALLHDQVREESRRYRTASQKLARILDHSPDLILTTDIDGNVTEFNRGAEQVLGRERKHVIGSSYRNLFRDGGDDLIEQIRSQGRLTNYECHFLRTDGAELTLELNASLLKDENDATTGTVWVGRDVTELKSAQLQLLQAKKLSSIGEVISGVAHELNNPLSGVLGFSQLLVARHPDSPVTRDVEKIYESAQRCQKIVKNLLSFARVHKPERKYLGINGIIDKTLELRRYQLQVNDIEVVRDFDPDLPRTMLDFHQVQQVLLNLINNAQHAMMALRDRPGCLTVRTRVVGDMIELQVADNGEGMTQDTLERVFDPFFTTKELGRGTGLGLSVSYGIVKEHGGRIYARTHSGNGSTFVIEFPVRQDSVHPEETGENPERHELAHPGSGSRLLVVDDEPMILDLIVDLFQDQEVQVDTAGNGSEACRKISQQAYDVVLTDVRMPQMNGLDLYTEILGMRPEMRGRVIFMTGDLIDEEISGFLSQVDAVSIPKPLDVPSVLAAVAETLERR